VIGGARAAMEIWEIWMPVVVLGEHQAKRDRIILAL
jgi:hypothetical protein